MKKLIRELPRPNQDTMKVLFSHLLRYTCTHLRHRSWHPAAHLPPLTSLIPDPPAW